MVISMSLMVARHQQPSARLSQTPRSPLKARDRLRQSLLKYCQRDTLALARVHQWLIQAS
jgi:hypothetical protein